MKILIPAAFTLALFASLLSVRIATQPRHVSLCPGTQVAKIMDDFVQTSGEHDVTVMCVDR